MTTDNLLRPAAEIEAPLPVDQAFGEQAHEHVDIFGYEPGPILRVHEMHALPGPTAETIGDH